MSHIAERPEAKSERVVPWTDEHWSLITVLGFYVVAVFLLYPIYRHRINPDATAYFSIAGKYARGDWFGAISGHWPPLLIWLIALGLKAGLNAAAATTAIDTAAGVLLLWSSSRLADKLGISAIPRFALLIVIGAYCSFFTFSDITPDFLLASILTLYLVLLSDVSLLQVSKRAYAVGVVGGLGYYAKPYALYFILAHLVVVAALDCWANPRAWAPLLRRTGIVIVTILVVAAPWVASISWKYGQFTISTAGDSHFRQIAPAWRQSGLVNVGLAPLPNPTASNYWEEPTRLNLPPWSPWQSRADLDGYIRYVRANVVALIRWTLQISVVALAIFMVLLSRWFQRPRERTAGIILSAAIIYSSGYCLLAVVDRYLWPVAIWMAVLAFSLFLNGRKLIITILLALSFLPHPIFGLLASRYQGENEYRTGQTLKTRLGLKGNVASSSEWHSSLYICYFAGLPYYGTTAPGSSDEIRRELDRYNIQYFFVWKREMPPLDLLEGMLRISSDDIPAEMQIYTRQPVLP
jgi:hypothetical protein